jgi:hypothetical protein
VKSVSLDDPIGRKMNRIIRSDNVRRGMIADCEAGVPPLASVDRILQQELKSDYGKHNEATSQAGYIVTKVMREHGYEPIGQQRLPADCVAESGKVFKKLLRE